jgi:hypothetical protein
VGAEPECSEAAIEPFRGTSLRTSDQLEGSGPASFAEKDPFRSIPFPDPCSKREKKGGEEKDTKLNNVAHLFFDAVIMAEVKRRPLRLPKVSPTLPRS